MLFLLSSCIKSNVHISAANYVWIVISVSAYSLIHAFFSYHSLWHVHVSRYYASCFRIAVLCQNNYRKFFALCYFALFLHSEWHTFSSDHCSCLGVTEFRRLTIFYGSERQSSAVWTVLLKRPPALRLVLGKSTGLFGFGLERSLRDQARRHFALATSCFQEEYCKTEQGIGLLTISVRQRAANLDLAKYALWRDSISPGQAVWSQLENGYLLPEFQLWSHDYKRNGPKYPDNLPR